MNPRVSFLLLFFFAAFIVQAQEAKQKNILFIAVDDLKPLLSNYGFEQMHTPNFDRLAKNGVTFTNAHVQYAVCGPSRASIMTGMYPDRTKVWDLHTDFRESASDLASMPEYLATQGYTTTGIGKIYHKGSSSPGHDGKSWTIPHVLPDDFDPAYGDPAMNTYQDPDTKAEMNRLAKEAKSNGVKGGKLRNYIFKNLKPSTESADVSDDAYQDGLYTQEALRKLKLLKAGNKPFFLALGYQRPHLPFVAPQKYWDLYDRDKIDLAAFQGLSENTPRIAYHSFGELRAYSDIDNEAKVGDPLPESKQRELIHGYMACISYIDAQLGKVLDALEELELADNTVIALWGDHGFHLGDHTLWCKHSNFEQATRIPLMFSGPGVSKDNHVSQPVELVDVFPTLFDLAGVPTPNGLSGISLKNLMDGNPATVIKKDYAVSQYKRQKKTMGYTIRTERYRYTEWHTNNYRSYDSYQEANITATELYDYQEDPDETRNFAVGEPAYKEVLKELKEKLQAHLNKEYEKFHKPVKQTLSQPNILFIHIDDLGYHDLGCTGSEIYQTPHIDKLAQASLTFENAYSSYPRCTPSRYALMTGTYPVKENKGNLSQIKEDKNFIKLLNQAGYKSSYVGKWHLGDEEAHPSNFGFDHTYAAGKAGGTSSRFYPFNLDKKGKKEKDIEDVKEDGKPGDYLSDLLTNETIEFIKESDKDKPFFAMLSYYAVHTPLEAKPEDKARNAAEISAHDFGDGPEYIKEGAGRRKMRQDDADYAGMVENVDENIGKLLETLEVLGLTENTIIVISSDHGGLSNGGHKWERHLATTNLPLKAGKGWLYEGGIRVPLIMHWPGKIAPKVDKETIILGMDVFPTLLDLAIQQEVKGIDGASAVPAIEGKENWADRTVYWHSSKSRPHSTGDPKTSAIRMGDYKLLHFYEKDRVELYNLKEDIGETNDLSTKEAKKAKEMLKALNSWKKEQSILE